MLKLSTEQKAAANSILERLDKVAGAVQKHAKSWGMPFKEAKALVNHIDKIADDTEAFMYGQDSLRRRQAEIAIKSEEFSEKAIEAGLITKEAFDKAALVIQRDSDEPYMETFQNPMKPIQTDADEPYMDAYSDDQSSAVGEGEDETGRDLVPEY